MQARNLSSWPIALALVCAAVGAPVAAQEAPERVIGFGHLNNPDPPVSLGMRRFAELPLAKSGGKLKVSEFGLVDFPFAVASHAQADALLDGPFGQALVARLPETGLVALGYWDLGLRNVTNSKRPITRPQDLDGLKLRVIPNAVFLETFKAFKANPLPRPFVALYGALESKAVDGQENPFSVIRSNKFYEVQKFVSATHHVYAANIVLVSKRFWDKLSPAEQKMMVDAANESRVCQRHASRAAALKAVAELQAKGMLYNEPSAAEQRRRADIARPVTDRLAAVYDPAIVKLYNDELARLRK